MVDDRRSAARPDAARPDAARLDAELARREDAGARMSASLVELEHHPGHVLLSGGAPTGRTGQRWAAAQEVLSGLWRDFTAYRSALRDARAVRDRRGRPGPAELAELHRLLVEPGIEVDRTAVALAERGLTGASERVEQITPGALADRMEEAFGEVVTLVVEVDAAHRAALDGLVPVLERLAAARRTAAALGIGGADPEAAVLVDLADRAAELHRRAGTDPLAHADAPAAAALAALDAGTTGAGERLARLADRRDRWPADLAAARHDLAELGRLRVEAGSTRARAAELVAGRLPALPVDDGSALRAALDGLDRVPGWAARLDALAALRSELAAARARLVAAHELAAGRLARRDELRGRFTAFRARAARLGRAEDPRVLDLDARLQRLLWTRPCDLVAATRELAAYRGYLVGPAAPQAGVGGTGPSGERGAP
jgi:hypothetical protein